MGLTAENMFLHRGLAISGVTCRAGRHTVLHDVCLSAAPGHLLAVLGPPGSGKSVLMQVLAGVCRSSGEIRLDGQDVSRLPAHRRGFGVVQQSDALFAHMTMAENVAFPLRMRRVPSADRARIAEEALDMVGLAHAGRLPAGQATVAERQRAMLARATVFAPRLLLLDEPFSDQDPAGRATLTASLRRIHDLLGTITLLATRNSADALATADHIAILQRGALVQHGPVKELVERPRTADIAALLGEQNRLPGRVEALEDDIAVVRLDCGPTVEALAGPLVQPGHPCQLLVRPDQIAIAAVEMGGGAIDAVLIEARFLGESYRLRLLIGSGAELIVRRPAAAGLRGLSVGAAASVAWQPHTATAFPP